MRAFLAVVIFLLILFAACMLIVWLFCKGMNIDYNNYLTFALFTFFFAQRILDRKKED